MKNRKKRRNQTKPKRLKFMLSDSADSSLEEDDMKKLPNKSSDNVEIEDNDEVPFNHPAMNEALQNPLILSKIMEELTFIDLLSCRRTSLLWQENASKTMLKKDCSSVKLKYDWETRKYRLYRQGKFYNQNFKDKSQRHQYLKELNKILEKSNHFPSSHFLIFGGNLGEKSMQKFFEIYGHKIKTLGLLDLWDNKGDDSDEEEYYDFTTKPVFQQALSKLSSIENLTLRDLDFTWDENDDKLRLPFLKKFGWEGGCETAKMILMGAPNLKIIENFDFEDENHLKAVTETCKSYLVKELVCDELITPKGLSKFLLGAGSQLKLEKVEFDIDKLDVKSEEKGALTSSFKKLLESCKDTLQVLELSELCSALDIQLPKFSCLKELSIGRKYSKPLGNCFPPQINLSQTFPKLRLLDCTGLRCDVDANWNKHFPPPDVYRGTFETVDTLEILDNCRTSWMFKLQSLCPNFKKLNVYSEDQPHVMLPKIFEHFQHLEGLELNIQGYKIFNLDSALTGISAKTCARLRGASERETDFEMFFYRPALHDLKGLKTFKISLDGDVYRELVKRKSILISNVSGLYAFKLLEDLKVTIEYDHNCPETKVIKSTLSSIAEFVNFAHVH